MKNDARLDLRLSKELKARIEMAAEGSVNAWVRDACERKMDPYRASENPEEAEKRAARLLDEMKRHSVNPQILTEARRQEKIADPPPGEVIDEIPLPSIAPRKWGK